MSLSEIYGKLNTAASNYDEDALGKLNNLKSALRDLAPLIGEIKSDIEDGDAAVQAANDGASAELDEQVERAGKVAESVDAVWQSIEAALNELDEATTDLSDIGRAVRDWRFGA